MSSFDRTGRDAPGVWPASDLAAVIDATPIVDTHEHLGSPSAWVGEGPDVLGDLFGDTYITSDLVIAGAHPEAVRRLLDPAAGEPAARFAAVADAWRAARLTGWGEIVRTHARRTYGIEDLTPDALASAAAVLGRLRRPGGFERLLLEEARVDHVQVDGWRCNRGTPDELAARSSDLVLFDLNVLDLVCGYVHAPAIEAVTGVTIRDLPSLRTAIEAVFAAYGPLVIALKSQHAYERPLRWDARTDDEAAAALAHVIGDPGRPVDAARICLGDWCTSLVADLAAEHGLPFKIHTGYLAGLDPMDLAGLTPGVLSPLIAAHPRTRFVLMHAGYPFGGETIALAKHFPNVYVDLCWAWSVDPVTTVDFVRRFIHAVPISKLFAFGGDTYWPTSTVAYADQARRWLARTLEAEVADGWLDEPAAIEVARRVMRDNQYACFDVEGRRAAVRARATRLRSA